MFVFHNMNIILHNHPALTDIKYLLHMLTTFVRYIDYNNKRNEPCEC